MPVDFKYLNYCQKDNPFYVPPGSGKTENLSGIISHAFTKSGWEIIEGDTWTNYQPVDSNLPAQGWKIHISSDLFSYKNILKDVAYYCLENNLIFKHLSSYKILKSQNSKYANRSSSGKFITLYPEDNNVFSKVISELENLLEGYSGPYILSDKRWKNSIIYYRYGAFKPPEKNSPFTSSLVNPDGEQVEDVRLPQFTPPAWADKPEVLLNIQDSESRISKLEFPFEVIKSLHFSNGGGVYLAKTINTRYTDKDKLVILKEARPFTATNELGEDSVDRLYHEYSVLKSLDNIQFIPKAYGIFKAWEHTYLVEEYIEGNDLKREWMRRTPILKPYPWQLKNVEYLKWLKDTIFNLETAVEGIHNAGWLIGDIHPKNIIMKDGVMPYFIDFEFAHKMDASWRGNQGAPGYEPHKDLRGIDADKWSLGILQLDLMFPQATLADQGHPEKISELLHSAEKVLEAPKEIISIIKNNTLDKVVFEDNNKTIDLFQNTARGILATASLENNNDYPIFPSDIVIYEDYESRLSYPYGATGVLGSLKASGFSIPENIINKYKDNLKNELQYISSRGFKGKEGVLFGLKQLGLNEEFRIVQNLDVPDPENDISYWSGWSGIGLYLIDNSIHETHQIEKASTQLETLLNKDTPSENVGLLHGWSGPALFWTLAYKYYKKENKYLELAVKAIEKDLAQCSKTFNGTIEYDQGWRTLPYLGIGSCGVAFAINELREVSNDSPFNSVEEALNLSATYFQYAQASLAQGVGGFLIHISRHPNAYPNSERILKAHIQNLKLHSISGPQGTLFKGNQGLRLSTDFLNGSSGVLSALAAYQGIWSGIPFVPKRNNIKK